jgi:CDP-diacylglycerol--glycerol-3-phosphate 3-phosphatidyltransferase
VGKMHEMSLNFWVQGASLVSLRRRWWMSALLSALLLWLGYYLLRVEWHPSFAWRWVIVAAGVLAYELGFLWWGLKDNHRRGESTLLPTLGAGNYLTLLRGLALGSLAGFLFSPWPSGRLAWSPALLYTLAILADYLDGYLARITHHATLLGEALDIEFDALGMLIATSLAVHYHQLPWWYLLIGLSRYLFLFGIWWRKRQGKPVYDLPPSIHRRIVAGFQMGFASVMLWPLIYPPATTLAGVVFAIPFTASFTRDWFVVSGRLDPTSHSYLEARRKIAVVLTRWLPVLLRMGVVALTVWAVLPVLGSAPERMALFAWPGVPLPGFTAVAISLVAVVAMVMLILGVAGRLAALGVLIAAVADFLTNGLDLRNGFLLVSTITLMLLGSGSLSWWCPEDSVLSWRAGEKRDA